MSNYLTSAATIVRLDYGLELVEGLRLFPETASYAADFEALNDRFNEDPEAAADAGEVLDGLESLDPPEEIADAYEKVIDVSRQTSELDVEDPAAVEEMQQLSEEAAEAEAEVTTFLTDECEIDLGGPAEAEGGTVEE